MRKNFVPPATHAATNPYRFGAFRTFTAFSLALLLFFVGIASGILAQFNSTISDNVLTLKRPNEVERIIDPLENRALNILVSGTDSRYVEGSDAPTDPELTTIRSDTTLVAHISADRSRVQVISIPRDLLTNIPSCTLADGSQTRPQYGMFNNAFALGAVTNDIAGGIDCTRRTFEKLSGLTIDAFAVVDFSGFENMVGALGGIWMDPGENLKDPASGLDLEPGYQLIDPKQALAYARARKNVGDGSDLSRIGRQQQLIGAMMQTLKSKNFVTDLPSLLSFVKASLSSVSVSPELGDLYTSAGLLNSLTSIPASGFQFVMMPVQDAPNDPNRVVEIKYLTQPLWKALKNDEALPPGITYRDWDGKDRVVPKQSDSSQSSDSLQSSE